eukprot:scaffold92701_cov26-Tisochrysis_lutea.AAC.3
MTPTWPIAWSKARLEVANFTTALPTSHEPPRLPHDRTNAKASEEQSGSSSRVRRHGLANVPRRRLTAKAERVEARVCASCRQRHGHRRRQAGGGTRSAHALGNAVFGRHKER